MDNDFIELHNYREALSQEFQVDPKDPPDVIRSKAREFAIAHLSTALDTLANLLHADKDPTRLAAAKTIINIAFATTPKDDTDPIEALYAQIFNTPKPPATPKSKTPIPIPEPDPDPLGLNDLPLDES